MHEHWCLLRRCALLVVFHYLHTTWGDVDSPCKSLILKAGFYFIGRVFRFYIIGFRILHHWSGPVDNLKTGYLCTSYKQGNPQAQRAKSAFAGEYLSVITAAFDCVIFCEAGRFSATPAALCPAMMMRFPLGIKDS